MRRKTGVGDYGKVSKKFEPSPGCRLLRKKEKTKERCPSLKGRAKGKSLKSAPGGGATALRLARRKGSRED